MRFRHESEVVSLAFSPDGRRIAYWVHGDAILSTQTCRAAPGQSVSVAIDGKTGATGYEIVWRPVFSPDSRRVAHFAKSSSGNGNVLLVVDGHDTDTTCPEVMGSLALGLLFSVAFVAWELRASAPMIPMRLFASRPFAACVAASLLFYAAMYGVLFLLPQFLQVTLGFGPLGAGLRLLPWTSTLFLTAPIAGAVVQKFGERPLVVTGLLMQAAGLGWIAMAAAPGVAYAALVVPLVLAGVGVSMAMPAAQNAILGSVAATEMGKASGVFNMGRFLGGMFGIALLVTVFSASGATDTPAHFSAGFAAAIMVAAALSLCGAFAGLWLPGRRSVAAAPAPQRA